MAEVKIKNCDCKHAYQDKIYGKGRRAHNINIKGDTATCTVCGKGKPA